MTLLYSDIAQTIMKILKESPTIKADSETILIVTYVITDYVYSNFDLIPKKPWYGKDAETMNKRLNQLKQEIAICTSYINKLKQEDKCPTIKNEQLMLNLVMNKRKK
jgi:hypothetical protein